MQGVGFRYFVVQKAREVGVDGWVRNRLDGTVEAVVRGDAADHELIHGHLQTGPSWSRVDSVVFAEESEPENVSCGFEVRGTV